MDDRDRIVLHERDVEAEGLDDWRMLLGTLRARFATGTFARGLELLQAIGAAAEEADHHPDVELTYPRVDVRLRSHDVEGVTARDVRLARTISRIAAERGVAARPAELSVLELALDTADHRAIKPFWAALLGHPGDVDDSDELIGPSGALPALWFQRTEPHATPRQRWHLDLRVPPEEAAERIARAVDAGGTLVSDAHAPAFWVLADAEGNKACITTWQGREG